MLKRRVTVNTQQALCAYLACYELDSMSLSMDVVTDALAAKPMGKHTTAAARVPSLHLQVYSVELVGVMGQACKRQLDIIYSALCPGEHQSNGLESHAQQQRIPCMTEPYQLVRALFILLQNPLNGQLLSAEGCCLQNARLYLCSSLTRMLWVSDHAVNTSSLSDTLVIS